MDPALAVELEALSRQKAMNEATERGDSAVQQFYCGATVFVTGGSGFLGKQLVEKLFRACNVAKVYLLMRPKKGVPIEERLEEMLKDPVYNMVRKKKPNFVEKIIPVAGNVADIRLGMSDQDWAIVTKEVNVIFHMAATTRFDEALKIATMINVRGTREAVLLGKECQKLKSFVYVSTTYANATDNFVEKEVLETFYPPPVPPELMISMAETIDEDRLQGIEADLIKGYPNTYTFAKAIAEEVVRSRAGDMPISIVRPAVVISSYREPMPGWADTSCAYGASGLILGPATGLIHATYAGDNTRYSLVPVDYVNNAILAAGWKTNSMPGDVKIYSVSSARNLFHWQPVSTKIREIGRVLPTPLAVWYMFIINTANKPLFVLLTWLLHYIPGYILDGGCVLLGKPPMFIKLYNRVYRASLALSYFTTHSWLFRDDNTDKLFQDLSTEDKLIFNFDTTNINIMEYVTLWCVGLRKYLMKDGIKNTEYAIKKQFWLQKLHYIVAALYVYVLYKICSYVLFVVLLVFGWV
ncbi:putative fatty acyl-CoA reductase CG5065 [Helicoverpa armigera]|uniref:putative fatty acyl-CoA reductase CG5065 n=1 Tax=Helicoverpa armigera TaxID=29058 RepID=UPI003082F356